MDHFHGDGKASPFRTLVEMNSQASNSSHERVPVWFLMGLTFLCGELSCYECLKSCLSPSELKFVLPHNWLTLISAYHDLN